MSADLPSVAAIPVNRKPKSGSSRLTRQSGSRTGSCQSRNSGRVPDGDSGFEYIVEVSGRAHEAMIQRALAHEFAEIRTIERRRAAGADVAPDSAPNRLARDAPVPDADVPAREALSPHDMGRLAELEMLAQLARQDLDEGTAALYRDEAQRLADHLGLVGDTPDAAARRLLALAAMAETTDLPEFIRTIAAEAETNPFLSPLKGTVEHVMGILADRYALAEQIDRGLGVRQEANSKSFIPERVDAPRERQNFTSRKEVVLREGGPNCAAGGCACLQPSAEAKPGQCRRSCPAGRHRTCTTGPGTARSDKVQIGRCRLSVIDARYGRRAVPGQLRRRPDAAGDG